MRVLRTYILLIAIGLCTYNIAFGQDVQDSVRIYFRQGYSNLDISIGNNRAVLNRIADSLATSYADSVYQLKNITVIGGASPEGSVELNKRLSMQRANVLFDYLSRYGTLPSSSKHFIYLGRDWQGLLKLVILDDNVPYKAEVIQTLNDIISKSNDDQPIDDNSVWRLMSLRGGEPYRYMYQELFPELRASRMILSYDKIWNPIRIPSIAHDTHISTTAPELLELTLSPMPVELKKPQRPFYMGIKTNMLYDAALVPNIGVEFYLGGNYSFAANWMYAWWKSDSKKWYWRTYGGDVAIRRWLGRKAKEKPLTGHHLGLYGQALTYDLLWNDRGYMAGEPGGDIFDRANFAAGLEYGYSLPIARRLNIDFTLGVGYMWGRYYEYKPVDDCYVWQATKNRRYIGPTKAEISLVWLIGRGNVNAEKGGKR